MNRTSRRLLLALLLLLVPAPGRAAAPPALQVDDFARRTDAYGDPLPATALARMGSRRLRHWMMPPRFAFSADGRRLASLGWSLRIWELPSGRLLRELPADAFFGWG